MPRRIVVAATVVVWAGATVFGASVAHADVVSACPPGLSAACPAPPDAAGDDRPVPLLNGDLPDLGATWVPAPAPAEVPAGLGSVGPGSVGPAPALAGPSDVQRAAPAATPADLPAALAAAPGGTVERAALPDVPAALPAAPGGTVERAALPDVPAAPSGTVERAPLPDVPAALAAAPSGAVERAPLPDLDPVQATTVRGLVGGPVLGGVQGGYDPRTDRASIGYTYGVGTPQAEVSATSGDLPPDGRAVQAQGSLRRGPQDAIVGGRVDETGASVFGENRVVGPLGPLGIGIGQSERTTLGPDGIETSETVRAARLSNSLASGRVTVEENTSFQLGSVPRTPDEVRDAAEAATTAELLPSVPSFWDEPAWDPADMQARITASGEAAYGQALEAQRVADELGLDSPADAPTQLQGLTPAQSFQAAVQQETDALYGDGPMPVGAAPGSSVNRVEFDSEGYADSANSRSSGEPATTTSDAGGGDAGFDSQGYADSANSRSSGEPATTTSDASGGDAGFDSQGYADSANSRSSGSGGDGIGSGSGGVSSGGIGSDAGATGRASGSGSAADSDTDSQGYADSANSRGSGDASSSVGGGSGRSSTSTGSGDSESGSSGSSSSSRSGGIGSDSAASSRSSGSSSSGSSSSGSSSSRSDSGSGYSDSANSRSSGSDSGSGYSDSANSR